MTVSAVARLIPRPPALVDSRKANCWAPGAGDGRRNGQFYCGNSFCWTNKAEKGGVFARRLTVEAIDSFLSHPSGDAAIDPLVLVALVLQEVLEQVQHLGHLQQKRGGRREFVRKNNFMLDNVLSPGVWSLT